MMHKDVFTRREAIRVIGRFRDPRTVEPLIQSFRDNQWRPEASQALRDLGPMAEPEVLALLKDDHVFLRRDAILVLKDIGTEKSIPALRQVAATGSSHVAGHAREALAAIDQRMKR
jgi:HEAT repeat protein